MLIELLNEGFARPDLTLKFFDLVVEHKLELFKLLGLLIEISDLAVLVTDCRLTFCQFVNLTLKLGFLGVELVYLVLEALVKVCN